MSADIVGFKYWGERGRVAQDGDEHGVRKGMRKRLAGVGFGGDLRKLGNSSAGQMESTGERKTHQHLR